MPKRRISFRGSALGVTLPDFEDKPARTVSGMSDRPSRTTSGLSTRAEIGIGDHVEPLVVMNVREAEAFESQPVGQIAVGTDCEVIDIGSSNRINVTTAGGVSGWISSKTDLDQPLVKKVSGPPKKRISIKFGGSGNSPSVGMTASISQQSDRSDAPQRRTSFRSTGERAHAETLAVGDQCETVILSTVRAQEDFSSDLVSKLPVGTPLEVLELGASSKRLKVRAGNVTGWISQKTDLDQPLIKKVTQPVRRLSFRAPAKGPKVQSKLSEPGLSDTRIAEEPASSTYVPGRYPENHDATANSSVPAAAAKTAPKGTAWLRCLCCRV